VAVFRAAHSQAADLLAKYHAKDPKTFDVARRFSRLRMPWSEKLFRALIDADIPASRKAQAQLALAEDIKMKGDLPRLLEGLEPARRKAIGNLVGKETGAQWLAIDPAKVERQAVQLYQEAAAKYGKEKFGTGTVADHVKSALFEIQFLSIGKTAPEIEGEDIDAKKFKLSDYRGKVVVLDFWGNW